MEEVQVPIEEIPRGEFSRDLSANVLGQKCKPLKLEWYGVGLKTEVKEGLFSKSSYEKTILKGISGSALPGEVLSIMGPSGGGKTSLLNSLSRRQHITEGKILLNGRKLPRNFNKVSAYVMQDDKLFEVLTPRELFQFSANLRLPRSMSQKEKDELVEQVIVKLKLQACADTRVGGHLIRGLSGGERKRTSIGYELITNPSLLFLDEPTSGLDSFTSLSLLQSLRELAQEGHTIICTIHQPSSEIFQTFDKLTLLVKGEVAYNGEAKMAMQFFSDLGYPCPTYTNPCDFFMTLLQTTTKEDIERSRIFVDASAKLLPQLPSSQGLDGEEKKEEKQKSHKIEKSKAAPFWVQLYELTKRGWIVTARNPVAFRARMAQTLFMALLVGFVYFRLDYDQSSISDRQGALFFVSMFAVMSSLMGILITFPLERHLLNREQSNGMYSIGSYFLGKLISSLPLDIFFPLLLSLILYWTVGFNNTAEAFFRFLLTVISLVLTSSSMGLLLGSMVPNAEAAVSIAPIAIIPFILFGGFFANLDSIPVWLSWIQYISVYKWGFEAFATTEFKETSFFCTPEQLVSFETPQGTVQVCPITSGDQILQKLGLDPDSDYWIAIGVLLALFVFFRLLSYAFLVFQIKRSLKKTQT